VILVTGATGLVGSRLCKRLVSEGYEVVGLTHNRGNIVIESLLECGNFNVVQGDVRKQSDVWGIFNEYKIKTVFHTAAQLPYTPDKDLVGVNVAGTYNLLKLSHVYGVGEFIYASSMGVYSDPPNYLSIDEIHPTQPSTEYGKTKYTGELLCNRYKDSMMITILRFAGVYGLSSEKNRAVNNFIRNALNNEPLTVDGDGSQSSDFVYVDDIIKGIYLAWQNHTPEIYNIGSGRDITIKELAKMIIKLTGSKSEIVFNGEQIERPFRFYLDIAKAKEDFGYLPCSLKDGLSLYIKEWQNG